MHAGVTLEYVATYLHPDGCRAAKPQIQQNQIGDLHLHQCPEFLFGHSRTDDFRIGNLVTENLFRPFQLQLDIFYNDNFKFHVWYDILCYNQFVTSIKCILGCKNSFSHSESNNTKILI